MPPSLGAEQPFHIAVCLFPGFQVSAVAFHHRAVLTPPLAAPLQQLLDLCGPLDILNVLDRTHPLRLSILSTSLEPVTTRIPSAPIDAPFQQHLVPTHTFAAPPEGVQAIFVPGGFGARKPPPELLQYLRENGSAPSVEFLMSVCTGSALLAMAGLLDGKKVSDQVLTALALGVKG